MDEAAGLPSRCRRVREQFLPVKLLSQKPVSLLGLWEGITGTQHTLPSSTSTVPGGEQESNGECCCHHLPPSRDGPRSCPPNSLLHKPLVPKGSHGQVSPSPFLLCWVRAAHTLSTLGQSVPVLPMRISQPPGVSLCLPPSHPRGWSCTAEGPPAAPCPTLSPSLSSCTPCHQTLI